MLIDAEPPKKHAHNATINETIHRALRVNGVLSHLMKPVRMSKRWEPPRWNNAEPLQTAPDVT